MKKLFFLLLTSFLFATGKSQVLVLKDSANNIMGSFSPESKIKKQLLLNAKKVLFQYSDSSLPEYDFYLTTASTPPFIRTGNYGNVLAFDFKLHLENIIIPKEATMAFDVKVLVTKSGSKKFDKGALFYIIE
jgi:hypothetical protein